MKCPRKGCKNSLAKSKVQDLWWCSHCKRYFTSKSIERGSK